MKRLLTTASLDAISQRARLAIAGCVVILFSMNVSSAQSAFGFTTIDFPGADSTAASDINNAGQIVGNYAVSGRQFGFLLSGGTFTTIDPPGASYSGAQGINDAGQIVGWYNDAGGARHYFLFSGGTFNSFDSPSPFSSGKVFDINNAGQMVGTHSSNGVDLSGFLFSAGSFTAIDYPSAADTVPTKINELGQIVGHYSAVSGNNGFLLGGGSFSLVAFPGAESTAADGINNGGQIVGGYVVSGSFHGYLLNGASLTTIDFPGSANTEISGINDSGLIVGEYWDASGFSTHGFLATLTVTYNTCPLYDQAKAVKSGATIPIKLQLCDANGSNLSLPSVLVTATAITRVSDNAPGLLEDAGDANPDNNFRYDSTLGATGGYIFNLSTRGLSTGTYRLSFAAGSDPTTHSVEFQVK